MTDTTSDLHLPGEDPFPEGEEHAPPGVHAAAILRWALVAAMALGAGAVWVNASGGFHTGASAPKQAAEQYYCPMHPSVVQDHPGDCPICNMTLVKKETTRGTDGTTPSQSDVPDLATVDLSSERVQLTGMRTAQATREKLVPEVRIPGYVTPNEGGLAQITTRFAGFLERLEVSQTGQHVKKGQVLASIYSPELLAAEQEFLDARKWAAKPTDVRAGTEGLASDARRKLELLGLTDADLTELTKTGKPMRTLKLRSRVDGYVLQKNAVEGDYVQPGTVLFAVADLSTVWVVADVYESEIERVHVGERATLKLAALPSHAFAGTVQFVYPSVDRDTRTLRVRLQFANPGLLLKPNMYGDVTLEVGQVDALVVPAEALVDTGEKQYVFVARAGGHFDPRRVRVGVRSGPNVQILEGLSAGETVVTTANFLLDSESRLRSAIEGAPVGAAPESEQIPIDQEKYPDKARQWKACEVQHRGMGTMEEDCKNAIEKPWK